MGGAPRRPLLTPLRSPPATPTSPPTASLPQLLVWGMLEAATLTATVFINHVAQHFGLDTTSAERDCQTFPESCLSEPASLWVMVGCVVAYLLLFIGVAFRAQHSLAALPLHETKLARILSSIKVGGGSQGNPAGRHRLAAHQCPVYKTQAVCFPFRFI